ncbi:NADPH:quinone reductase [Catellatospora sp. TT07R-123]|uniref:NADP-dependent oxidoreductase n=1 Tax=Catellatospora sp. TT07R-123 TaxID=2733863 RepID=UPI001B0785AC|nr:NADP-dependent oxidoreductase [Catellatospora sp. TT07R-123]GHJ48510.1 NADPH:quinone reductase [Catellatospora sp. TT07R-123]
MTERMLAIRQDALGGPEVLRLAEVDRPHLRPTEVLVRVHAAGVNPVDWKVRRRGGAFGDPPFTVGWDVSGVVEQIGPGVTRFDVGDEVFGMPRFPMAAGAYAQYVTSPSRQLARKPAGLDHVHAAALPLAALTAWQALVDTADVRPGQRVLVHAAAGGVGHLAVQIAKARGAYVLGTAREAKHGLLRELGVDEPIDYTSVDFEQAARDVDVVLDTIGGDYEDRSLRTLRPGGILVGILNAGTADQTRAKAAALGVRGTGLLVEPDHTALEAVADLVEAGRLHPVVAATFPLAEAARAHELGEAGRTSGKIVLTVD